MCVCVRVCACVCVRERLSASEERLGAPAERADVALKQVYGKVCDVVDPMYLKVEQTVGMALPLILNKYMGLFVALAFFPVMAFTIPFLVRAFSESMLQA